MPLPDKLLHEDEDVLFDTRPSWTALVAPVAFGAVVLAACIAGLVLWSSAPLWFGWLLLAAVLFAAAHVSSRVLRWRATALAVTTSRVVFRTGVLRRFGREIPIESVQDVSFHQGLFERIARAGSVTVESAGERGALPFLDVPHPETFQRVLNGAVASARGRSSGGTAAARHAPGRTIPDQIAQLAALYERGVLTAEEFTRKKAELLDRM
ncbi:MAG: hypothetical protein JWO62_624 [Acidimicrobiaceae bacterium]|nr:hypothetical protein [Acidimicrobiaceae bacterium]